MKRFISLVLALMLAVSLVPAVSAGSAPAVSSNIGDHFYINAGRYYHPIYSNLAWENGQYVRAEAIGNNLVVESYDQDFQYLSGKSIPLELPIFGGVRMDTDYNFVVVGQTNYEEDDNVEVFRIIRYTKDWEKVDHTSIYGANTYIPFDAGSLRFDRSGDILYIRTSHEMYADENGTHHQANVMIALRISDMTVTDQLTGVLNSSYGYVSHSFNQFVRVDGDKLLAVDHGDYYPRSVALFRYPYAAGSETFYGRTTMVNALPIADSTYHYNDTGVSVGGFEFSSTDYLIAGSAYDMSEKVDLMYAHRNIFVTATPKDNFTDEGTTVNWLTNYAKSDGVEVSPPHLLKLSADRFFLTWTEDGVLKYCFLNGKGELDSKICSGSAALSDCQPILAGTTIVWYVTNGSKPVFYLIDAENPGSVTTPHDHDYTYRLRTDPTELSEGLLVGTCSKCDVPREVVLPILSTADYDYQIITKPGHETTGLACYTWRVTTYGIWSFKVTLSACSHSYDAQITAPTCTVGGHTTYTCTLCGHSYVGSHTDPLGHDEAALVTDPTCTAGGFTTYTCTRCGAVRTGDFTAALGHDHAAAVTEPTCTAVGFTTYTCTRCGDTYVSDHTPAQGHSYGDWYTTLEPTCTASGTRQRDCLRCDASETDTLTALGHDYEAAVTDPGCETQGFTTHTCKHCGDGYVNSYVSPLGHKWDEGTVITEPTEEENGLLRHSCLRCDAVEERIIPALGHTHTYESIVTDPTCTDGGYTTHTCACGDSYKDNLTAALGHDIVVESGYPATCTEDGLTDSSRCDRCGLVLSTHQVIPSHGGHDWKGLECLRCGKLRENPFSDTNPLSFYFEPVLWAVENGITNGITATTFEPLSQCQRSHVVTFLWRAAGKPEPASTYNPFVDVEEGRFYYKAVLWAVEQGITKGMDATHFGPDANCSRAQVVTFLHRSLGRPEVTNPRNPFVDVKPGKFYYDAVLWAVEQGVTNGLSASEFGTDVVCSRGQIVTFLYRTFA